jgi:hypothetical protein
LDGGRDAGLFEDDILVVRVVESGEDGGLFEGNAEADVLEGGTF